MSKVEGPPGPAGAGGPATTGIIGDRKRLVGFRNGKSDSFELETGLIVKEAALFAPQLDFPPSSRD